MLLSSYSTTTSVDDAGVFIHKRVLPRPLNPGNYSTDIPTDRVPSLSSICLHILAKFPDQVRLTTRLYYRSEITAPFSLDPRLWCILVQVYDGLPQCLHSYNIPLSDIHLPLLQRVPSTPQFSLITLLDLPACPDLTDDSISTLKLLHSLVAFDASATVLSSHAVKVLARTLVYTEYDTTRRGPWTLRILRLRNCKNIDNNVYSHLPIFPLLSVVGTFFFILNLLNLDHFYRPERNWLHPKPLHHFSPSVLFLFWPIPPHSPPHCIVTSTIHFPLAFFHQRVLSSY